MSRETVTASPSAGPTTGGSLPRRVLGTFLLGVPGILALVGFTYLQFAGRANLPATPAVVAVASAVVPTVALFLAALVGSALATRVGLRSVVVESLDRGAFAWPGWDREARVAVALGLLASLVTLGLDLLLGSGLTTTDGTLRDVAAFTPVRLLYGGLTEELLVRFGLMSLFVWAGWRLTGRPEGGPGRGVGWTAVVLAALAFGLGHLPAAVGVGTVTPAVVARVVGLNFLPGLAFGWLYWRHSLEAAMVAHATFHVPYVLLSVVLVLW